MGLFVSTRLVLRGKRGNSLVRNAEQGTNYRVLCVPPATVE
jgi:hypothetical protein